MNIEDWYYFKFELNIDMKEIIVYISQLKVFIFIFIGLCNNLFKRYK